MIYTLRASSDFGAEYISRYDCAIMKVITQLLA